MFLLLYIYLLVNQNKAIYFYSYQQISSHNTFTYPSRLQRLARICHFKIEVIVRNLPHHARKILVFGAYSIHL